MGEKKSLVVIYIIFIILTLITLLPIILYLVGFKKILIFYTRLYFFVILIYISYRFSNLAYADFKKGLFEKDTFSKFTVIVPCYNEDSELLKRSIQSVENADGDKEVIIIDDGSTNGIWETIKDLKEKYNNIIVHRFEENKGKRHALHWAFKKVHTKYIVTIDSDTLIDKYAFSYLLSPLSDNRIGATTGNIILLNEKRNLLTRVIASMYLCGLKNYKKAQSALGNVICCSGCLSAYKTYLIKGIADQFLNQRFLGSAATHSEDRHLTNLILERGYKVVYVERAICYTETPHTLRSFLRQQQRWKRRFVRETIYLLSHSYKGSKSLFFEATIGNALPFFLSLGIQVLIVAILIFHPLHLLLVIIPSWLVFITIKELPMFLEDPTRAIWFYLYIPLYEILLFWQNMWAIVTVNNADWLTRKIDVKEKNEENLDTNM